MHLVFHSYDKRYNIDNLLFKDTEADIGDNLLLPFKTILVNAQNKNISVSTSHNINIQKVDAIVFIEMPKKDDVFFLEAIRSKKKLYLLTLESPLIKPDNYDVNNHDAFSKVFTWSDDLILKDYTKYIKINYSFNLPSEIPKKLKDSKKLLTLIAGNKNSKFQNELYSQRVRVIKFMENNHPLDFGFYGTNWDYFVWGNSLVERALNKCKIKRKLFNKEYKSYLGPVGRKNKILQEYAFSVCYENIKNIPGYITEKIFDSFFAGCVPIYLGANNINEYVPSNCFIDQKAFTKFEDVYDYIKSMSEQEYNSYFKNIELFLNSSKAIQFSNGFFSKLILDVISQDN